jgi:hypothetical protein
MTEKPTIRLIKHEAVAGTGSYEVRFRGGRASRYFYFEDVPSRRLRPDMLTGEQAKRAAQVVARMEQNRLLAER